MEEWECGMSTLPEPIRDSTHNPCQSVDCPNCGNQSETNPVQLTSDPSWISSHSVSESEPPTTIMADRYMNIMLNQPSFNLDSTNMIAEWKHFCGQVKLLLVRGPYTGMEEKQKVATLLNWMTDKGQKIYKEDLIFPTEEPNKKDKEKLTDDLDVFDTHFTPLQSMTPQLLQPRSPAFSSL